MSDGLQHKEYYNQNKIEPIEVIEDWNLNFNLGNVIKYVGRSLYKEDCVKDLEKAKWYIERELYRLNKTITDYNYIGDKQSNKKILLENVEEHLK